MSECHTASNSEEHLFHTLHLHVLDGTSDELQSADQLRLVCRVFIVRDVLCRLDALEAVDHLTDEIHNFMVVLKLLDAALDLFDGLLLRFDEACAILHFILDGIEEEVVALLLLRLDQRDVTGEYVHVLGSIDLDEVFLTCVEEVDDASLCLITLLDALLVDEFRDLDTLVHVEELHKVLMPKTLDNLPCVVFGSRQLEQLHRLWSTSKLGLRVCAD